MGTVLCPAFALSGCCAFSAKPYRQVGHRPSKHYSAGAFRNERPLPGHGLGDFLRFLWTRSYEDWTRPKRGPQYSPPPREVAGGRLRITFINHATLLIQLDGLNVLTDPIFSERASPLSWVGPRRIRAPGVSFSRLPPIHLVVISHNHYDHMDLPTLRRLQRRFNPVMVAGLGNASFLQRRGLTRVVELDWWQSRRVREGLRLHFVPATHFSSRGVCDRNQTLWGGFVLESSISGNVYFAGDTGWGPHFRVIGKRFAPLRAALLPIGAFLPRWFMAPVHISPAQAVRAHRLLGARVSIGMHFGTFRLADDRREEPAERIAAELKHRPTTFPFWLLGFGEGREIPIPAVKASGSASEAHP